MNPRYTRYRDLLPTECLKSTAATIVGVGAIGRQVALQLSAMGVGSLQLVDFDIVDAVNLGPQGYREADVGLPKVEATAALCRALFGNMQLALDNVPYTRSLAVNRIVFVCVDSIRTRKMIWRSLKERTDWLGDARMAAETLRILVAADSASREHYAQTLFRQADAYRAPCTAKATIYCANVAAGLMVAQFARWLRRQPTDADIQFSLLAMEACSV